MALSQESPSGAGGGSTPEAGHGFGTDHLDPIAEESEISSPSPPGSATEYLSHEDPVWQTFLASIQEDWTSPLEEVNLAESEEYARAARLPLECLQQTYLDMEV